MRQLHAQLLHWLTPLWIIVIINHLVLAALLLSLFFVKWENTIIKTSLDVYLLNKRTWQQWLLPTYKFLREKILEMQVLYLQFWQILRFSCSWQVPHFPSISWWHNALLPEALVSRCPSSVPVNRINLIWVNNSAESRNGKLLCV